MHALELLTNHKYGIADIKKNKKIWKKRNKKALLKLGTVAWAKRQNFVRKKHICMNRDSSKTDVLKCVQYEKKLF